MVEQALAQCAYRIPYGEPADDDHCDKDEEYIDVMDAHGISVDDERAVTASHADESESPNM